MIRAMIQLTQYAGKLGHFCPFYKPRPIFEDVGGFRSYIELMVQDQNSDYVGLEKRDQQNTWKVSGPYFC